MPVVEIVVAGSGLDTGTMEEITQCDRCGKHGRSRTQTCEVCEHWPASILLHRILVAGDRRLVDVPLCDSCHIAIRRDSSNALSIEMDLPEVS
jgi:hypothetical protein